MSAEKPSARDPDDARRPAGHQSTHPAAASAEGGAGRVSDQLKGQQSGMHLRNEELQGVRATPDKAGEHYSALFDLVPVAILVLDEQQHIVELNQAASELLGRESARLKGRDFQPLVAAGSRPALGEHLATVFREGDRAEIELTLKIGGNESRAVRLLTRPLPAAAGEPRRCLSVAFDLTGTRQSEMAWRENEVRFRTLLESMSAVAIQGCDPAGTVHFWNSASERVFGFSADEALGRSLAELIAPTELREDFQEVILQGFKPGAPRSVGELVLRRKDGASATVFASQVVVRLEGRKAELYWVEFDLSERKKVEEQLREVQKLDALARLAGGVAHGFNNILTTVLMNVELLEEPLRTRSDLSDYLLQIQAGAQRAADLTRQLLSFSRQQVLKLKTVDLNPFVNGLSQTLGQMAGDKIELRFAPGLEPMWVRADDALLGQVVMNLIGNARDAMPEGGRLTLRLETLDMKELPPGSGDDLRPGRFHCLSVTDTGRGMDEATLHHAFDPFFTLKELGKGTGLGLASAYGIAKQHQGWLEAKSRPGEGSTFRLFLPVTSAPAAPEAAARARRAKAAGRGETILVVEDELAVRRLVTIWLQRQGYEVLEAAESSQALDLWRQHWGRIDLLVSDMLLADGGSGLDLWLELRGRKGNLKAVITSGYGLDTAPEGLAPELRADFRFLAKPFSPSELLETIRHCLDAR
ncbi:MAG: PAS domain S-box protein [Limisphaerales bacterium]